MQFRDITSCRCNAEEIFLDLRKPAIAGLPQFRIEPTVLQPDVVTKLKCRVFRHLEMSLPVQMGAEPAPARSLH